MASTATKTTGTQVTPRTSVLTAAAILLSAGIGLVWLAGFANAEILHNGAHDSRHAFVFPCH